VFIAYDAHPDLPQRSLSDPDSCPMSDRWRRLRKSGVTVDFQRILRSESYLPCFKDFVLGLSGFEERSVIGRNQGDSIKIYLRRIDGALTVVKAISLSGSIERRQIETEVENLLNLCHQLSDGEDTLAKPLAFLKTDRGWCAMADRAVPCVHRLRICMWRHSDSMFPPKNDS
jgi:hypothetical protein